MAAPISGASGVTGPLRVTGGIADPGVGGSDGPSFAATLKKALGEVSELQGTAKDSVSAFLRGEDVELHQVMAAAEEAGIALELLVEIRNKLIEAYRSLVSMQG